MKKTIAGISLAFVLFACNSATSDSPKKTVAAFIEASKTGEIAEVKKYISKSDASLMQMGESFLAKLDPAAAKEMKDNMLKEFKEKTKNASIEIKDEKIDGDNATVDVSFIHEGRSETRPFSLVKEDGQWKVSLMSTGMKNSGASEEDLQEAMKHVNMDSLQGSISMGMEEFNKMDKDSLKQAIQEGMKELEKLKASTKKN